MLPDLRFAIGAVLVSALLIASAFGMAANVRIAHHRAVGPLEAARILAFADPMDLVSGPAATRRIGDTIATGSNSLPERIAAIPFDPGATALIGGADERELPDEFTGFAQLAEAGIPLFPVAEPPDASPAATDRGGVTLALAAVINESSTAEPRAEQTQAAVPKEASATAKKKVVKKRKLPARTLVAHPAATTGYHVTDETFNFGAPFFQVGTLATRPSATCATDAWRCR